MRTIEVKLYQFSELSEKAKEKAIEWYRETTYEGGYHWAEEYHESLQKFCKAFNLNWRSSSVCEYSKADVRTSHIDDCILELSGIRLLKYLLNNYWDTLYVRKKYGQYIQVNGKWRWQRLSKCQWVESDCIFTGFCADDNLLQPIREFIKKPDHRNFEDLMNDCIESWKESASNDCQSQMEEEYIIETIEANEYEFTEEGDRY